MKLGWCPECGDSYKAARPTDELCARCQVSEPRNDATPFVETPTWKYSRRAMQERLGVSGREDI